MSTKRNLKKSSLAGALFVSAGCLLLIASAQNSAFGNESLSERVKGRDTSFYRDFFDSTIYNPFASFLRFDELSNKISRAKKAASDVNLFDEVPDSAFFVNRHGKIKLDQTALKKGPEEGNGPNVEETWKVFKGKGEGVSPGLFIEDDHGVKYILKFDPMSNPEMATAAEAIGHRFFYAIGYHVPEYYLVDFKPSILSVTPDATYYDENGFKKKLTKEALWDLIDRVPKRKGGLIRASASKLIKNSKGYMDFDGRRTSDPEDLIPHGDRRSIRALRVFASWLNHYDLRKGNTLDAVETKDGAEYLKHYLIDFGSTLGSAANHAKVPVAGYEHIVDWQEIGKAIPTLKMVEKPWEKRWDEANRTVAYPALGYFDNRHFNPGKWKTQLHYDAFKALTKGDAFWAAKIIMSFSDEDIRTLVETGGYSDPELGRALSKILIERRNLIGRYWFSKVTPLDQIHLFHNEGNTYEATFKDLFTEYGFADSASSEYRCSLKTTYRDSSSSAASESKSFNTPSFSFEVSAPERVERLILRVQAKHGSSGEWSTPPLRIELLPDGAGQLKLARIDHGA